MKALLSGLLVIVAQASGFWLGITTAGATVGETLGVEIAFEANTPYYQPQQAIVPANVPIRWVNLTASAHSVRHDGCLTEDLCAFQSIAVPPDSSFAIPPLAPGQYSYHCELHPIMRGTLIVVEPPAQAEADKTQAFTR